MPVPSPVAPSGHRRERPAGSSDPQAGGSLPISLAGHVLRALKTSESVAREIVHDIVDARLQQGDGLPSEAAMLQHYGVSRESLREALRLLESQGLITIRRGPGGGPIVGVVDPANLGRMSTLYYYLVGATYGELFDTWVDAETRIAELAARNPDRAAVRAAMAPYVVTTDGHEDTVDEFVRSHTQFHVVLGSLADNKVMALSLMAIGQIVTHHVVVNADPRDSRTVLEARPPRDRVGRRQRAREEGELAHGESHPGCRRLLPQRDRRPDARLHRLALTDHHTAERSGTRGRKECAEMTDDTIERNTVPRDTGGCPVKLFTVSEDQEAGVYWQQAAMLREETPAFFNTHAQGYWVVTRYEQVKELYQNVELFSSESFTAWEPEPALPLRAHPD